jgi:hypothetical protein
MVALLFAGCKKNDDTVESLPFTMVNIAGTYTVTDETTASGSLSANSYATNYDPCERDDTYTFSNTGTFVYTDAGTKCSPPSLPVNSTYSLSGNVITIIGATGAVNGTIQTLTSTYMKIYVDYVVGSSITRITTTYTRQ